MKKYHDKPLKITLLQNTSTFIALAQVGITVLCVFFFSQGHDPYVANVNSYGQN